ncbi:DUF1128 domain-containing protein [Fictibacillus sp. WQ 8-8]|uniref:DUF1128 domain-containing protein n=1 Tax=Fictibacillus marinisediminis TaxID=2878389 RepID=A0A9X1XA04_9BACL|nr:MULTISPECIES: DUF1128 domain-containing protein [Fictibacillus]SFD86984.1 Uncharacterized protein YfkK, UPF0435 family [Bacillus sp. OV194]MCK6256982.1 DUF1128 domain-containing protein [Fictibacillus marinisediminis]MCQ6265763.1 DUF1128 domain-containing protein [Fictibacillus sp. WQ 8-8]MED2973355.1 DUF1128 domain-containing protein [Fictibacillus sp. B-59209]UZJ77193.1 DUF1128 domain-containing protein [Fictibacillus sp. KU28468]
MNLSTPSQENIEFMIEGLKKKLQLVNSGLIQGDDYTVDQYDDIKELYDMVMKMPGFSVRDMEGIVSELGSLKKK